VYELPSKTWTGTVGARTGDWSASGMVPSSSMRTILISASILEEGTDSVKGAAQRLHVFDPLDPIDI
jgi:hypothetical protein